MAAANINICTDGELEARAQSVLANLGLDMATAINMFLTQVVDKETLPFEMMADDFDAPMELQDSTKPTKGVPQPNCLRGKIWMADDFDAPMEEFEEYM